MSHLILRASKGFTNLHIGKSVRDIYSVAFEFIIILYLIGRVGGKKGLSKILVTGSRNNCDFGNGFYLGETYNQALSFVFENDKSSVYSFRCSLDGLDICKFDCSMEWMLAICYHRGTLGPYSNSEKIKHIVDKINTADVIIAPIADNKMFYVMAQFTDGEINADVALHSLSASKLGFQYIFKTEKALNKLIPI